MTRWLVTGGAGFIGSHLCEALIAQGDAVRVLDDLSTGRRENLPPGAVLIEGDVTDPALLREALTGVAGCYHLAAIASVQRGINEWTLTHRVNQGGAITLFDVIRRMPERIPVVYASSAAVYGNTISIPVSETDKTQPLSAYGVDKLGCEMHARVAAQVHGIPNVGLRFFNVYGPRQDSSSPYSGVISIFCDRIRQDLPVDIFGDGTQTRDFVYVADVIAALTAAMRLVPKSSLVLNVCTGLETSIEQLAWTIADLAGRQLQIRRRPPRAGEVRRSRGSPELSARKLALLKPIELRQGLRYALEWLDGGQIGRI